MLNQKSKLRKETQYIVTKNKVKNVKWNKSFKIQGIAFGKS